MARLRIRSVFGNASASSMALKLMYSADHGPRPFVSRSAFRNAVGILSFRKGNGSSEDAAAEISNRLSARRGRPDFAQIGFRQDFRTGKQAGRFSGYGMSYLIAIAAHELTDKICSLCSRNQLPQYRADRGLKGIPSPRQPQARKAITEFRENRNPSKAIGNENGIGI